MTTDSKAPAQPAPHLAPDASAPELFINRELSLIDFQERVLDEAVNEHNPLLERVRFLSIVHSNLDEFFMVRVSGLQEQVAAGVSERSPDGLTPTEELAAIRQRLQPLLAEQAALFAEDLCPALAAEGVYLLEYDELTADQRAVMSEYFDSTVFPVCTPLAVDPGHPFPHISNLSLNLAVELQDPDGPRYFARVKVPSVLPRLIALPNADRGVRNSESTASDPQSAIRNPQSFVWLEQILGAHLEALFPQMQLLAIHPFRVIRDADIEIQELEADDLLESVEQSLYQRRFGSTVALFVNPSMPEHIRRLLAENLELDVQDIYTVPGPLGLSALAQLYKLDRPDLKYTPFVPRVPPAVRNTPDLFYAIQQHDILLHHPYDSFNTVVDFIRAAANDPNVLAIKQTLYRIGTDSPIVDALLKAADAGKQVAVLMELKARFDEENNIESARHLEQAGVHVTYGLIGLKTHCKIALVVRKEGDGIRRYVHLGTGNYNPGTARGYTDFGLLTARPAFGADASELFNYLTGYSKQTTYRKLLVAPLTLRSGLLALIEREIARQREHGDGRIIFKMNSLVDPQFVRALYRASQAGVQVDLIVRGTCALRPGVPGVSDHIRVFSVVGRFLEHSRVYYFFNGGQEDLLLGSSDLRTRNLDHRVETLFPVEDEEIRAAMLNDVLEVYLRSNGQTWELHADGTYARLLPSDGATPTDIQANLLARATGDQETVVPLSALPKKYRKYLTRYGRVDPAE